MAKKLYKVEKCLTIYRFIFFEHWNVVSFPGFLLRARLTGLHTCLKFTSSIIASFATLMLAGLIESAKCPLGLGSEGLKTLCALHGFTPWPLYLDTSGRKISARHKFLSYQACTRIIRKLSPAKSYPLCSILWYLATKEGIMRLSQGFRQQSFRQQGFRQQGFRQQSLAI